MECMLFIFAGHLGFYSFERIDLQNIPCEMSGFYRTEYIIDTSDDKREKIVMNGQAFAFEGIVHMFGTEQFFLLSCFKKKYVLLCADDSNAKAVAHICIFDITDMEHIQFYSLTDCYYRFGVHNPVAGSFRDGLCFFASQWIANGEYFMCPFFYAGQYLAGNDGRLGKQVPRLFFRLLSRICPFGERKDVLTARASGRQTSVV